MAVHQLSLWLQPEPVAAAELDAVIKRLAAVHGTATFSAHLTVLGAFEQHPDGATAALAELAASAGAVRVRFAETRCEPPWHRSLYLAAIPDPALRRLAEQAVRAFEVTGAPAFEPHLSLQYSELPVADKLRLAARAEIRLPLTVRFDRLSLWHTPGADASRWRMVAEHPLAAG
jgi:2'-5' RNA ligase